MVRKQRSGKGPARKDPWSDPYTERARQSGYPARSIFKLQEMQRKFRLIKKGHRVLDLGCAPGSWLLYAAALTGEGGRVIGLDLKPVTVPLPPHAGALVMDVFARESAVWEPFGSGFNVVLSDMAPDTTGTKHVDAARSLLLCERALDIAGDRLATGGTFVCKIFFGQDVKPFSEKVKRAFKRVTFFKPAASRKASREIYIIGIQKNKRRGGDHVGTQQVVHHQA